MKIAILGWGSLLWQPKNLQFDKETGWSANGPFLPIEFARISKDGRLTLVITPKETKEVKTYFAISSYETVEEAVLNLAVREGSGRKQIGSYDKSTITFSHKVFFESNILKAQFATKVNFEKQREKFEKKKWFNNKPINLAEVKNLKILNLLEKGKFIDAKHPIVLF